MRTRPGFTLLEMIVAIAISLILVGALYMVLNLQFRTMNQGRNLVAENQLARGLIARMASDIHPALTKRKNAPTGISPSTPEVSLAPLPSFGTMGNEEQLTLFLSTAPRFTGPLVENRGGICDLRRVTYQLIPGEGLVRREIQQMLATSAKQAQESWELLGPEVVALRFRYFDGGTRIWLPAWDGTIVGPPLAIEVTLLIQPAAESSTAGGGSRPPAEYRQIVAVPGAVLPE